MSLLSLCKRGSLEAVKAALLRGEMEEMNCDEKLHCATTALKSGRETWEILTLIDILMEHLRIDRFEQPDDFICIAGDQGKEFLTFHASCVKKAVASPGSESFKLTQSFRNGMARSQVGLRQRLAIDREIAFRFEGCFQNTYKLVQMNKVLKEALKEDAKAREEEEAEEKETKKNSEDMSNEEIKSDDATGQRRGRNTRRRRRRKEKARGASDDALDEKMKDVLDEKVKNVLDEKVKVKDVLDEKVKVKADLRSKLSQLELEEETEKKKLSSAVDEHAATSSALEGRMVVVLEEKDHLGAQLEDVESAMESLVKRKGEILKKKEQLEKETAELKMKREESKESSVANIRNLTAKLEKVQTEVKKVRKDLDLAEGRTEKEEHLDLESFMARQIQELREELECPVCLEVTSKAPIYKCSDDHLICRFFLALCQKKSQQFDSRQCRPKLSECPQCREVYPEQLKR